MGTPQTPSSTLSVFQAPASSGEPVLMAVPIILSQLPQLAILQPPLEVTVECVSVQHDFHLEQSPTMNSTVDVSEVAPCRNKTTRYVRKHSLVPRPSTPPVYDRLQYKRSKTGGVEGLGRRLHLYTVSIIKPLYRTGTHSISLAHGGQGLVIIVILWVYVSVCRLPLYLPTPFILRLQLHYQYKG